MTEQRRMNSEEWTSLVDVVDTATNLGHTPGYPLPHGDDVTCRCLNEGCIGVINWWMPETDPILTYSMMLMAQCPILP